MFFEKNEFESLYFLLITEESSGLVKNFKKLQYFLKKVLNFLLMSSNMKINVKILLWLHNKTLIQLCFCMNTVRCKKIII